MSVFTEISFTKRKGSKRILQTPEPWTAIPHQAMDKLEFEQWRHVTRFKSWKASFRREVLAGSTHPRQATDWLAEIDQAASIEDLDDGGSVHGNTRMSFETMDSHI